MSDSLHPVDTSLVLQKIRYFCSYQERSISEVEKRLNEWAVQNRKIPSLINQLQSEGYINEERFARTFAGGKFRLNKWGRRKIGYELQKRGVPELIIQEGLLEIDEEEYRNALKDIMLRKKNEVKPLNSSNIRWKIVNFVYGKGYEMDIILRMVRELKI
jgi:regulatory protein